MYSSGPYVICGDERVCDVLRVSVGMLSRAPACGAHMPLRHWSALLYPMHKSTTMSDVPTHLSRTTNNHLNVDDEKKAARERHDSDVGESEATATEHVAASMALPE